MKFLRYFIFLASNWNLRIAGTLIKEEVKGEKKYGIDTTGSDDLIHLKDAGLDISNLTIYMPASYLLLTDVFSQITPASYEHFLDIGCGKGRAVCVAAHEGFKKITGVEISKKLAAQATENVRITKLKCPSAQISIVLQPAENYRVPTDVDCIFMFNPFNEVLLRTVMENINESVLLKPRDITLIYLNSIHKSLLQEFGFTEVYKIERHFYIQAAIFIKKAASG